MKTTLQRVVLAYRPLYLNGLLVDGQYTLPKAAQPDAIETPRSRQRTLLAALISIVFHRRSK